MNPDQDAYKMIDTGPEDDFERRLRQQLQAQQAYLPDDGFSAQVMAALPAASAKSRWRERLLIGVPVLLISLLVFSQLPWLDMAYIARAWVQGASGTTWMLVGAGVSTLTSLLASLWYWRAAE